LIAMRSRRLRPGSSFTKRSISLFKPPSPRDIETKNPHILGAVSGGDSQYFVTLVLQHFVRVHGRLFLGVDFMLQGVSWQGRKSIANRLGHRLLKSYGWIKFCSFRSENDRGLKDCSEGT